MVDSDSDVSQKETASTTYRVGTTLRIREHLPPEPFSGDYGPSPRPDVDWTPWQHLADWQINRVDFVLANPPVETEPPGKTELTLTITGHKTRRTDGGAHVVTCFLDDDSSVEYVAKIYDGVDYPFGNREAMPEFDMDCMTFADRDYSIEAWAYRTMQPVIGGTVVPSYHGSWTFLLNTHKPSQQRWVRMILIELVQGECMLDIIHRAEQGPDKVLDYTLLPPEPFRLHVLQHILEAKLTIWWESAITHNDLSPRNVMVKPDGRVVLIDFNQVLIYDFIGYDLKHPRQHDLKPDSLPPSPIEFCWPLPGGFAKKRGPWARWVPQCWLEDPDLAAEWLVQTYRGETRFRPPSEGF